MDRQTKVWVVAVASALLTAALAHAEVYSVTVTRKDQDLYRTRYACLMTAFGQ